MRRDREENMKESSLPAAVASSIANIMDLKYDFSASVLSLGLIPDPLKKTREGILPITSGRTSDAPLPAKRGTWDNRRNLQDW
jgi:hypothetical protein